MDFRYDDFGSAQGAVRDPKSGTCINVLIVLRRSFSCDKFSDGLQSPAEIKEIIDKSRLAHGAMLGAGIGAIDTDEYIDDAMQDYGEDDDYNQQ
jgi:hypothetical protein